jgi:hypothetical protein
MVMVMWSGLGTFGCESSGPPVQVFLQVSGGGAWFKGGIVKNSEEGFYIN